MKERPSKEIPQDILEVRERFEEWRRIRSKPRTIPEELWQAALSLTEKYSFVQVAQHLRLNHTKLKARAQRASTTEPNPADRKTQHLETPFVELPPVPLFTLPEASASVVELAGADGSTLTIRLPSSQPVDLVALTNAFWRRG